MHFLDKNCLTQPKLPLTQSGDVTILLHAFLIYKRVKQLAKKLKYAHSRKFKRLKKKITTLQKMKRALSKWEQVCDGKVTIEQCPILESLYQPPEKIKEWEHDNK